jgi:malonyl-CoA/methylmalonyl-CoA synthetase
MNENLAWHFLKANQDASLPCIISPDGSTITYGVLFENAASYANALNELGLQPGDRVAVQCEKSIQSLYLYLGCLIAGGVYLPLNNAYTPGEIAYFLGDAEPRIFICDPANDGPMADISSSAGVAHQLTLAADGSGTMAIKASGCSTACNVAMRQADNIAAILYTSGTTGRSKGAMLTHKNLLSNAVALIDIWKITDKDCLLHALPIFHTHGLFVAISTTLLAGGSMVFLPKFDVDEIIRQLPKANVLMGVPTFYSRLLAKDAFNRQLTSHMRLFVSGSAPLSAETHSEFARRTGHAILERYGMTETNMNTSNPYDGDRRAGTVGFPLPGVELIITDAKTGEELPRGETGIIEVRGGNVFKGYWRNPEKTAEELRQNGFFITGDMARIDKDGYISIVGRDKDLIISGGFNIYPAEVETVLDAIEGVAESAVIGLPHADFGEGVTAIIALHPVAETNETEIITQAAINLAKFKLPKRVILIDTLPRNTMGKIQKNALREEYAELYSG